MYNISITVIKNRNADIQRTHKEGERMKDRYIGTAEIVDRLGCGRTQANEIMHLFEQRGQMYRIGRMLRVKERIFNDWLEHECRQESAREKKRRTKRWSA